MASTNIALKFGIYFGKDICYDNIFTLLYSKKYINDYNYLKNNAKRGDLLINLDIEEFRNYYLYIIDIIDDNVIIKSLDEINGYEGYPKVPIEFLDILLINKKYWFDSLHMNDDYDLDNYSIELSNLSNNDFIINININNIIHNNIILILKKYNLALPLYKLIYTFIENPIYWQIKNTKCLVNNKNLTNLIKYISYDNNNNNLISYSIIYNLFYINL